MQVTTVSGPAHGQRSGPVFVSLCSGRRSAADMGCFGFLKAMMFLFNGIIFVSDATRDAHANVLTRPASCSRSSPAPPSWAWASG